MGIECRACVELVQFFVRDVMKNDIASAKRTLQSLQKDKCIGSEEVEGIEELLGRTPPGDLVGATVIDLADSIGEKCQKD